MTCDATDFPLFDHQSKNDDNSVLINWYRNNQNNTELMWRHETSNGTKLEFQSSIMPDKIEEVERQRQFYHQIRLLSVDFMDEGRYWCSARYRGHLVNSDARKLTVSQLRIGRQLQQQTAVDPMDPFTWERGRTFFWLVYFKDYIIRS